MNTQKYIRGINSQGIFSNTYETKIPQTAACHIIMKHFTSSQKKPKCIFIGWDGCRGDAMKYLIKSDDKAVSGLKSDALFSAVNEIKKSGGLYITYVGGDNGFKQETSTAQGWSSALCGKWVKPQWKTGIEWGLDDEYPTVLRLLAQKGFHTSFSAIWDIHFNNTYKNEIDNAEKDNLEERFFKFTTDSELHDNLADRINADDDCIFGIYECPDDNGHSTGFGDENYRYVAGITNLDRLAYQLLQNIKLRPTFNDEDWLILIGSDHGGHKTRHGSHLICDTTTFLASSRPIASGEY